MAEADIVLAGARVADAGAGVGVARRRVLGEHWDARLEWRFSGWRDGRIAHVAIDRSFIDEHGTRWIIDYKTGTHEGGDREMFLNNEQEAIARNWKAMPRWCAN